MKKNKATEDELEGVKELIYEAAYQYYEKGLYEKALNHFKFLVSLDPYNERFLMGLGGSLQMNKNFKEAIKTYALLHVFFPDNARCHLHAAECFFASKEPLQGLQAIDKGFEIIEKFPHKENYAPLLSKYRLMKETWEKALKEASLKRST